MKYEKFLSHSESTAETKEVKEEHKKKMLSFPVKYVVNTAEDTNRQLNKNDECIDDMKHLFFFIIV